MDFFWSKSLACALARSDDFWVVRRIDRARPSGIDIILEGISKLDSRNVNDDVGKGELISRLDSIL